MMVVVEQLVSLFVTKPISLLWRMGKAAVDFHVGLCWKFLLWSTALVALPIRVLTALHRERYLEAQLHELQIELEKLVWDNKELEGRLHRVIKDRKVIETLFEEIEEEHEKALSRIDILENEVQDLKEGSLRLNEVQGKGSWDYKVHDKGGRIDEGIPIYSGYGFKGTAMILENIPMHGDPWGDGDKGKVQEQSLLEPQPISYPPPLEMVPRNPTIEGALERRRVVALYRSLFSSILSLLVGMIIWEADDPCMPLVAALFIVVGMSLGSVVQFFSTIKNKPASDAVALLSINWFILGTLSSPSLPRVARALAPQVVRLAHPLIIWLGFPP